MTKNGLLFLSSLSLSVMMTNTALASCSTAIPIYNSAIEEISSRLKRYTGCVSESRGKDSCSIEFGRLRSAQTSFEIAVIDTQTYCK